MRQPPPVDLSPAPTRRTDLNTLVRRLAPRLDKIAGRRLDARDRLGWGVDVGDGHVRTAFA